MYENKGIQKKRGDKNSNISKIRGVVELERRKKKRGAEGLGSKSKLKSQKKRTR